MTDALRMAGFAATAAMLSFTLRAAHRQAGAAAAMAAGLMLFFFALTYMSPAVEALRALSERAGVGRQTVTLLLKLVAMAYVTEFAAQACRDAGTPLVYGAIAGWYGQVCTVYPGDASFDTVYAPTEGKSQHLELGNLSFTAHMASALESAEAVKVLLERPDTLRNRLLMFDLRDASFEELELH